MDKAAQQNFSPERANFQQPNGKEVVEAKLRKAQEALHNMKVEVRRKEAESDQLLSELKQTKV